MDQQMVSFRCIPEDDRAAGTCREKVKRDRQSNGDRHRQKEEKGGLQLKSFCFSFLSCCSSSPFVVTKGQQLLQPSPGCKRERNPQQQSKPNVTQRLNEPGMLPPDAV